MSETERPEDEAPRLADFYAACDGPHREFFSTILREWQEAGLPWEWQERDIALCMRSAGRTFRLLLLQAETGSLPPSLTCELSQVRIRLGDAEADGLLKQLQKAGNVERQLQADSCRLPEPGNASPAGKQAIRHVLRRLTAHLPNALAP